MNPRLKPAPVAVAEVARPSAEPPTLSRFAPLIIGSALLMQTLDSTVITNGLPAMAEGFREDPVTLNLAITAYILASAVFLPISGWVADRFGAKVVFRGAMALFALSSLFCGLSHTLPELLAARMAQGMAGAMMAPVGRLVLLRSVPKSELVRAMTYLTMPALLGPVLGPPLGGYIVTHWSWRWIFYINVPIGLVAVTLVTLYIPNIREEAREPLDWKGFLLTGLGLAGVAYGFENIGHGGIAPALVAALLIGGGLCLAAFAWHARRTPHAILDLSVFRYPGFTSTTVGGAFLRMAIGALPFLLAMQLQLGFGLSPFAAGAMTFTSAAAAMVMRTFARPIIARFGFKRVLVVDTVISGFSLMSYGLFRADTPHVLMIALLLFSGFFRSLQFTAMMTLTYADIPAEKMSRTSTLASVAQQLSQSLGVGVAALLLGLLRAIRHSPRLTAGDVAPVFVIIGAMTFVGLFFFVPLKPDIGDDISGRRGRVVRQETGEPLAEHA